MDEPLDIKRDSLPAVLGEISIIGTMSAWSRKQKLLEVFKSTDYIDVIC